MAMFDCTKIELKQNSKEKNKVTLLQTALKTLGYYTRQIDGSFGYYTREGVKSFQKKYSLKVDGIFGPVSCKKMNEVMGNTTTTTTSKSATTTSSATVLVKDTTPEYEKRETYKLIVYPDVVVLPESETSNNGNVTKTGGSINTETNFDCSKINLKKGDKWADVTKLQTILKARGYYTRQVDGDFGKYTKKAVQQLQKAQGNEQTGIFDQKTCNSLQKTSATSNRATGTSTTKNRAYTITEFTTRPNISIDLEGLSYEITLQMLYSQDLFSHIRKLQKTYFIYKKGTDTVIEHEGYINDIKVNNSDSADFIEMQLTGYKTFLEQTIDIPEDKTGKKSELLKYFTELAGMKLNLDLTGLTDDTYTVKAQQAETTTTTSSKGTSTVSQCFDMAKPFIHPYHDKKYQNGSSTHDPETAWNAYQSGTRHFDCFGCSAFLFYTIKNFAKAPVRVIHRKSKAARSGTHYTVQLKENGSWIDPKEEYSKLDSYLRCGSGAIAQVHQVYEGG